MRPRPGIALVFLALVVACSSSTIVITESRTTAPGPIDRVAVFVSLPRRGGDRGIYHGIQKAMPGRLAACGVAATVVAGMPAADADASPPTGAQLIIRARYGLITTETTVDQYGNVLDDRAYKDLELELWFELFDHALKRATWLAFANVKLEDQGNIVGEKLAATIVDRLRADGVLTRCK